MQGNASNQIRQWLCLNGVPRLGVARLQKLRSKYQLSIEEMLQLDDASLTAMRLSEEQISALKNPSSTDIEKSLEWLQSNRQHFLLHVDHPSYPSLLKQISSPPMLLYGVGNIELLNKSQIAVVGSRNPSTSGKNSARYFASQLCQSGWCVTSGLAVGIDGLSHQGAIAANGLTIAILGTAIDNIYPKRHKNLAQQILQQDGVIISEFPPGTPGRAEYFPRRNRLISGMSYGTLVVEAAIKSGSLITARYALEQNREVFAIPGNIHNPLSAGCHHLIKQGAKLVDSVDDINEEFEHLADIRLSNQVKSTQKSTTQSLASDLLLDSVDFEVTPLDMVAERSGIPVVDVMSQLLEYELRGLVTAVPGGYLKLGEK